MQKLHNEQNITKIVMMPTAITKCAIGQDWFKNELEITFVPGRYYPEYMEVSAFIMDEVDGHELNIEDVVSIICDYLIRYDPILLKIVDHVRGCKVHFDVDVVKEWGETDPGSCKTAGVAEGA